MNHYSRCFCQLQALGELARQDRTFGTGVDHEWERSLPADKYRDRHAAVALADDQILRLAMFALARFRVRHGRIRLGEQRGRQEGRSDEAPCQRAGEQKLSHGARLGLAFGNHKEIAQPDNLDRQTDEASPLRPQS